MELLAFTGEVAESLLTFERYKLQKKVGTPSLSQNQESPIASKILKPSLQEPDSSIYNQNFLKKRKNFLQYKIHFSACMISLNRKTTTFFYFRQKNTGPKGLDRTGY